ncbi:MAG: ABC transporter permease subunit [Planctomycetota bacterium]
MIALKTWRELRSMGIAYILILEALLIPAVVLWPDLRGGFDEITSLVDSPLISRIVDSIVEMVPAEFMQRIVRMILDNDEETSYRAYLAVQMFFKGVNIVGIAAAILLGTGMVSRERENQTLEFLLSRPASRSAILWNKYWVTAVIVVVPIFLTSWSARPMSALDPVNLDVPLDVLMICSFHNAAFVLVVLSLTTIFSVLAKSQVQTAFWIGGVVILQVALYFVQTIRRFSAFKLSDFDVYQPVMIGNQGFWELFTEQTVWLLLAAVVLYGIADRLFARTQP